MGDPVSMAVMGMSLAATGLGAAGSIQSGEAKAQGDAYQAQQAEYQSQYADIKAKQTNAYMQENLTKTLSNISAVQASTGASSASPSAMAYSNYSEFLGDRDRTQQVSNIEAQSQEDQQDSALYQHMGNQALLGGFLGAAGDVAGGISGFAKANPGSFS